MYFVDNLTISTEHRPNCEHCFEVKKCNLASVVFPIHRQHIRYRFKITAFLNMMNK